jgi:hypothetical protein
MCLKGSGSQKSLEGECRLLLWTDTYLVAKNLPYADHICIFPHIADNCSFWQVMWHRPPYLLTPRFITIPPEGKPRDWILPSLAQYSPSGHFSNFSVQRHSRPSRLWNPA